MKTTTIFATRATLNECSKGLEFVSTGAKTCFVSGIGTCTDTDIKIPPVHNGEKVTGIGGHAFSHRTFLTSISVPNSVTSIGGGAFCDCSSLTSITIPEGVTRIGAVAFYDCSNLTSISIPDSVTSIGKCAFKGCTRLKNVTMGNGISLAL